MNKLNLYIIFCFLYVAISPSVFAGEGLKSYPLKTNVTVVDPNQGSITVLQHMVLPTFAEGTYPDPNKIRSSLLTSIPGGENGKNAIIKVDAREGMCMCYVPYDVRGYTNGITQYEVFMKIFDPQPPQYIPIGGYVEVILEGHINGLSPMVAATAGDYSGTGVIEIQIEGPCCGGESGGGKIIPKDDGGIGAIKY